MKLFRQEAVEHQGRKLWGEVIVVQPTGYSVLVVVMLLVLVGIGVFLSSQSYARKASVQGYLAPDKGLINVYASRGGAIEQFFVSPGDSVSKGQPLASLKLGSRLPSGVESRKELVASLRRELTAVREHLSETDERYAIDLSSAQEKSQGQKRQLANLRREAGILAERMELAASRESVMENLASMGHATQDMVDQHREELLALRQLQVSMDRQALRLKNSIVDSKLFMRSTLPHRLEDEQSELRRRIETLTRQLAEAELASAYVLTASVDGLVTSISMPVGTSARPNVPIVVIRSRDSSLIGKLMVPSRASGLLQIGQKAKIQYDAFPYQRFGVFEGTVKRMSESILTAGEMQAPIAMLEPFYLVDLELQSQVVRTARQEVHLKPGMLLKADITLEDRSLMDWVLDPLITIKGRL